MNLCRSEKTAIVLCEESSIWARTLRECGYRVVQVDLKLSPHHVPGAVHRVGCDARRFMSMVFDVAVGFPPCDDLSVAGAFMWPKKDVYPALELFTAVASICSAARVAGLVENPVGLGARILGKPDWIVHPWMFDMDEVRSKRTCLWSFGWPAPRFLRRSFAHGVPFMKWASSGDGEARKSRRSRSWPGMAAHFCAALPGVQEILKKKSEGSCNLGR